MRDRAVIEALCQTQWALDLPVLQNLVGVVMRHAQGEKLSEEHVDEIVGARNARRSEEEEGGMTIEGGIARIPIVGIISKRYGMIHRASHYGTSPGAIQRDLSRAEQLDNVEMIAYDIDSPGGSVASVAETANAIFNAKKPSVAIIRDVGASAAYWMASQADQIVAGETAQVGSIGVYTVVADMSKLYEDAGVRVDIVRSGPAKGIGTPGVPVTDEDLAVIQEGVDDMFGAFIDAVSRGRGMSTKAVRALADGRAWMGQKLIENGLVDALGTYAQGIEVASSATTLRAGAVTGADFRGELIMAEDATKPSANSTEGQAAQGDENKQASTDAQEIAQKAVGTAMQAAAASPAPVQPVQPVAAAPDPEAAKAEERSRIRQIQQIAADAGLDSEWADKHVDANSSVDVARREAFDHMTASRKPTNVTVGEDNNQSTIGQALADAMAMRGGIVGKDDKVHPRAQQFRYHKLIDMAKAHIEAWGGSHAGLPPHQIARTAFSGNYMNMVGAVTAPGHTTSSFPALLEDAVNKALQRAYQEAPYTWDIWMRRRTVSDFKNINVVRLGEFPNLAEVKEGDEYEYVTFGEEKEVYNLVKYGRLFDLTWETLVNDDLDGMMRIPGMMGQAARRLENLTAYLPIISAANGEVMGDGVALFDAAHNNLNTTAGDVSTTALSTLREAMRLQEGVTAGVKINVQPRYLLVPPGQETNAQQTVASTADPAGAHAGVANVFQNSLTVVTEVNLAANAAYPGGSDADWYVVADSGQIDTIEVAFLEGNEAPFLQQEDYTTIDGRRYKVRHVVASKAIDWRGMQKADHS